MVKISPRVLPLSFLCVHAIVTCYVIGVIFHVIREVLVKEGERSVVRFGSRGYLAVSEQD